MDMNVLIEIYTYGNINLFILNLYIVFLINVLGIILIYLIFYTFQTKKKSVFK